MSPAFPLRSALVWLRRDLRLEDHAALAAAVHQAQTVHLAYCFDAPQLQRRASHDRRLTLIHEALQALQASLAVRAPGAVLWTCLNDPVQALPALARSLKVQAVFWNRDEDPHSLHRDGQVRSALATEQIAAHDFQDHVIFERSQLLTQAGKPYTVFTPYWRRWLERLSPELAQDMGPSPDALAAALQGAERSVKPPWVSACPSIESLGFQRQSLDMSYGTAPALARLHSFMGRIDRYVLDRDYPARNGTSGLSVDLRFGLISIRHMVRAAMACGGSDPSSPSGAQTWLKEIAWRDFYHQLLHHHPQMVEHALRPRMDGLTWVDGELGEQRWQAWTQGRTGFALVDAAQRQLVQTGHMHNRMRMLSASFLCKQLGLDWRRGAAFFEQHLLDHDVAANIGGWQWCASTGSDAQPWFRIFQPQRQAERYDPQGEYVRRWLSPEELACEPVVDAAQARLDALARYQRCAGP